MYAGIYECMHISTMSIKSSTLFEWHHPKRPDSILALYAILEYANSNGGNTVVQAWPNPMQFAYHNVAKVYYLFGPHFAQCLHCGGVRYISHDNNYIHVRIHKGLGLDIVWLCVHRFHTSANSDVSTHVHKVTWGRSIRKHNNINRKHFYILESVYLYSIMRGWFCLSLCAQAMENSIMCM